MRARCKSFRCRSEAAGAQAEDEAGELSRRRRIRVQAESRPRSRRRPYKADCSAGRRQESRAGHGDVQNTHGTLSGGREKRPRARSQIGPRSASRRRPRADVEGRDGEVRAAQPGRQGRCLPYRASSAASWRGNRRRWRCGVPLCSVLPATRSGPASAIPRTPPCI